MYPLPLPLPLLLREIVVVADLVLPATGTRPDRRRDEAQEGGRRRQGERVAALSLLLYFVLSSFIFCLVFYCLFSGLLFVFSLVFFLSFLWSSFVFCLVFFCLFSYLLFSCLLFSSLRTSSEDKTRKRTRVSQTKRKKDGLDSLDWIGRVGEKTPVCVCVQWAAGLVCDPRRQSASSEPE